MNDDKEYRKVIASIYDALLRGDKIYHYGIAGYSAFYLTTYFRTREELKGKIIFVHFAPEEEGSIIPVTLTPSQAVDIVNRYWDDRSTYEEALLIKIPEKRK